MLKHILLSKVGLCTKDMCQFIAYCVTEFVAVFHSLLLWPFLFLLELLR